MPEASNLESGAGSLPSHRPMPAGAGEPRRLRYLPGRFNRLTIPEHVLPTSGAMFGNFLVTGSTGFIYWLAAARFFSTSEVGFAAAAVSAMMFLGIFAMAGLGTMMILEAPRYPDRERAMIGTGIVGAGILGSLLGLAFALVIAQVALTFRYLLVAQNVAAFAFGVGLTTAMLVLDQSLVGLLQGRVLLVRGAIFSFTKLIALLLAGIFLSGHTGMVIFATWVVGDFVSIVLLCLYAAQHGVLRAWLPREWRLLRQLLPRTVGHQMLNVGLQAPNWAGPVIVALMLGPELNASFYVASMMTTPGLYIPGALAFSLFAVAVRSPGRLTHQIRTTIGLSLGVSLFVTVGVLVFGRFVLSFFGPAYVEHGSVALILLTLVMFPLTVKVHFANLSRIRRQTLRGSTLIIAGAVLEVILAAVGAAVGGINGVALGVLIALLIEALVMLPAVVTAVRGETHEIEQSTDVP